MPRYPVARLTFHFALFLLFLGSLFSAGKQKARPDKETREQKIEEMWSAPRHEQLDVCGDDPAAAAGDAAAAAAVAAELARPPAAGTRHRCDEDDSSDSEDDSDTGCLAAGVANILHRFFTPTLIDMISKSTNHHIIEYSTGQDPPHLITDDDVWSYLSIIFYMGLSGNTSTEDHYSSDPIFGTQFCSSVMPRDRFKYVRRHFSVANPSAAENKANKLAKVAPLLELVRNTVQNNLGAPATDLALDETSVQCAHRNARCGYRSQKHKPRKDHIKIVSLCQSLDGYMFDFLVDQRTISTHDQVLSVLERLPASPSRPYLIATDRWYTAVPTALELKPRHIYMYGTIRRDRGLPAELLQAKPKPGESFFKFSDEMMCCVWRDSIDCFFLSTFHSDHVEQVLRRQVGLQGKLIRPAPLVAVEYNQCMGGVDRFNSLMESYSCHQVHRRRWYTTIVYFALDVLMVDACLLYNKQQPHHQRLRSKRFRQLAVLRFKKLADNAKEARAKRQRLGPNPSPAVEARFAIRLLPGHHLPTAAEDRLRCKLCYSRHMINKTNVSCSVCGVHLCLKAERNCFSEWHTAAHL